MTDRRLSKHVDGTPWLTPVVAVCGKGGVGKTAVSAPLGRALREAGATPLLLIDADPVMGLASALGVRPERTLADLRRELIAQARGAEEATRDELARTLDYQLLTLLQEEDDRALLAMGRTQEKGCFCAVNSLLRQAIDALREPFGFVLIDAEAGVEQINREVTRQVSRVLVVTDGSRRSQDTLAMIVELIGPERVLEIANRVRPDDEIAPGVDGVDLLGSVPEDATLSRFDREGRSLEELPPEAEATHAARVIVGRLLRLEPARTKEPPS